VNVAARQNDEARVAAVVLAAGTATRLGEQKLVLELGGRPVVTWGVDAALGSAASQTVVVLGYEAERVRAALGARPVTVVVNQEYEAGMSTSLKAGVRALDPACEGAVFLLGDQPFVSSALIDRLIARFRVSGKGIVRPKVGDVPANPVLLGARLFAEVLSQHGDVGGREIVARHLDDVDLVEADDPRLTIDVDTRADYDVARSHA